MSPKLSELGIVVLMLVVALIVWVVDALIVIEVTKKMLDLLDAIAKLAAI